MTGWASWWKIRKMKNGYWAGCQGYRVRRGRRVQWAEMGQKAGKMKRNLKVTDGLQGNTGRIEMGWESKNRKDFQISDSRKWDSNQKFWIFSNQVWTGFKIG
jgi:hypothetical protein